MNERLNEIFKDEKLVKELLDNRSPEDAQKWLSDHDVELSIEDIRKLGDRIKKIASGEITREQIEKTANGELSEAELEEVAGGLAVVDDLILIGIFGVLISGIAFEW